MAGGAISVHAKAISDVEVRIKKANGIFVEFYPLWKNKKYTAED
jgi:hypothetical protein